MHEVNAPKLVKWPFFAGDALLLFSAVFIASRDAAGLWQMSLAVICLGLGAILAVTPFLIEYRAKVRIAESNNLNASVATIKHLDIIAGQIGSATGHWQEAQQNAEKTAAVSREIAERMTAEVKSFAEFMERVNDREKATLRVELEKLRRIESEWLQVLIRMLDHVYALHVGAIRSGQSALIDQVGIFQNACRDAARRVGLAPFVASDNEPFDGQRHQVPDAQSQPQAGVTIAETIAAGYTFQGRLVRPALVRLRNGD